MPNAPFLAPERDSAFKLGRPKPSGGSASYGIPGAVVGGAVATWNSVSYSGANFDYYFPAFAQTPLLLDQLAIEVSTLDSGKNVRIGLYRASVDLQPVGAPLADSGDISTTTTGVKTYTPGSPVEMQRGPHLFVLNTNSTVAVFRAIRVSYPGAPILTTMGSSAVWDEMSVSRTYGAFPTPGTAWTTNTAGASSTKFCPVVCSVLVP